VVPARPGCEVKLLYEGKEWASVQTDNEGRYEFKEIPAGTYEAAPGSRIVWKTGGDLNDQRKKKDISDKNSREIFQNCMIRIAVESSQPRI
jgi:hypothetical protein